MTSLLDHLAALEAVPFAISRTGHCVAITFSTVDRAEAFVELREAMPALLRLARAAVAKPWTLKANAEFQAARDALLREIPS